MTSAALYGRSALRIARRRRALGSEERLVFVVGSPRSGTTFTGRALGSLPGFVDLDRLNRRERDIYLYTPNWAFWAKMALIFLAGINFLFFYFKVEPKLASLGPHDATPMIAKTVGALSLVFWFGVLAFGRLLPYLGTGGG